MTKLMKTVPISVRIPDSQYKELKHYTEVFKEDKTQLVIQALALLFTHLRRQEKALKESKATYVTNGVAQGS
jgi:hypothetical protein